MFNHQQLYAQGEHALKNGNRLEAAEYFYQAWIMDHPKAAELFCSPLSNSKQIVSNAQSVNRDDYIQNWPLHKQFQHVLCLLGGIGIQSDDEQAGRVLNFLMKQLTEPGNEHDKELLAKVHNLVGWMYSCGRGFNENKEKSKHYWQLAADQGNATAQYNLGIKYYNDDKSAQPDHQQAIHYLKLAAEQGYSPAQSTLGHLYYHGEGNLQPDYQLAVKYLTLAADQGYGAAQNTLGYLYYKGKNAQPDYPLAVKYLKPAADQGYSSAQCILGHLYHNGDGVDRNPQLAIHYLKLAADQEHTNAQYSVGYLYYKGLGLAQPNYQLAIHYLQRAANKGFRNAQYTLGLMYENGNGVDINTEEAIRYYQLAAKQQHLLAVRQLAKLFGNRGNLLLNYKWLGIAGRIHQENEEYPKKEINIIENLENVIKSLSSSRHPMAEFALLMLLPPENDLNKKIIELFDKIKKDVPVQEAVFSQLLEEFNASEERIGSEKACQQLQTLMQTDAGPTIEAFLSLLNEQQQARWLAAEIIQLIQPMSRNKKSAKVNMSQPSLAASDKESSHQEGVELKKTEVPKIEYSHLPKIQRILHRTSIAAWDKLFKDAQFCKEINTVGTVILSTAITCREPTPENNKVLIALWPLIESLQKNAENLDDNNKSLLLLALVSCTQEKDDKIWNILDELPENFAKLFLMESLTYNQLVSKARIHIIKLNIKLNSSSSNSLDDVENNKANDKLITEESTATIFKNGFLLLDQRQKRQQETNCRNAWQQVQTKLKTIKDKIESPQWRAYIRGQWIDFKDNQQQSHHKKIPKKAAEAYQCIINMLTLMSQINQLNSSELDQLNINLHIKLNELRVIGINKMQSRTRCFGTFFKSAAATEIYQELENLAYPEINANPSAANNHLR